MWQPNSSRSEISAKTGNPPEKRPQGLELTPPLNQPTLDTDNAKRYQTHKGALMTRFQLLAGVRFLGIFTGSLALANPLFAGQNSPLEVYRVRPQTVGVGSAVIRLIRPQGTPLLYDVALDATQVETTFPEVMEPRLVRPDVSKLSQFFRSSQGLIRSLKHSLRRVKEETGIVDAAGLADLFRESSAHTYTITHTNTYTIGSTNCDAYSYRSASCR